MTKCQYAQASRRARLIRNSYPQSPYPYANPYASTYANLNANFDLSSLYGSYLDPNSLNLWAASQIISAQGQLMQNQQQAFAMREQARSDSIANRQKLLDELLYERAKAPTAEDDRQKLANEQTLRSLNGPDLTEIWSGRALNDIVANLRRSTSKAGEVVAGDRSLPLDDNAFKHINVTAMKGLANVSLLRDQGRLAFPVALSGPDLQAEREEINSLTQKAVEQAQAQGQVDPGLVRQLGHAVEQMQLVLRKKGKDLPPAFYMEARTFMSNLSEAVRGLGQKDIGNYFNGKYALKAKTVSDLLAQLAEFGLQFAPALPGDEAAYVALHSALASYTSSANQP
jgi:hypothetical protein